MRKKINPEETVSISFEFILTIQHTHSPLGYQCFYVVMSRIFCYTVLVGLPTSIYKRKGVSFMNFIISFTLSVAAGVVSYYICKWLDDQFKAGKH